jgi:hypothetical protein
MLFNLFGSYRCYHVCHIRGEEGWRWVSVCYLQWWKHIWASDSTVVFDFSNCRLLSLHLHRIWFACCCHRCLVQDNLVIVPISKNLPVVLCKGIYLYRLKLLRTRWMLNFLPFLTMILFNFCLLEVSCSS